MCQFSKAGGLNPENISVAIEIVSPFGLDVCSGVRSNGRLDEDQLKEFFQQVNFLKAFKRIE